MSFCILHICTLLCAVTVSNVTENGDIFVRHMSCCTNGAKLIMPSLSVCGR